MKVRPIDAPFNIMGLPIYLDYYVVHNFETNSMSFSLHSDSKKPAPTMMLEPPSKVLGVTSTNTEGGSTFWDFFKNTLLPILVVIILVVVIYILSLGEKGQTLYKSATITLGIVFFIVLCMILWNVYLDSVYEPEIILEEVEEAPAAAAKVYDSGNLTVAGLISFFVYKFLYKRNNEQSE